MKRLAIAFFYDRAGIVDDYFPVFVNALRPFVEKTIFVSNGELDETSLAKAKACSDTVIIRDNIGFDVWAYKEALEFVGFDALEQYDEVILYNHTNFGPIFPFAEMFEEMESRDSDIWGITDHVAVKSHTFMNGGFLHWHINSHFVTVRKSILQTDDFRKYWQNMPMINSYVESVRQHESQFADYFIKLGFNASVYIASEDVKAHYALMEAPDVMVQLRCPIFKRRIFFGDVLYTESNAVDAPRALRLIEKTSEFDLSLIWKNVLREIKLREMNTNLAQLSIFPDYALLPNSLPTDLKIAVCAHILETETLESLLVLVKHIPITYDLIITTNTDTKAAKIKSALQDQKNIANLHILLVESNRGQDMSALFISCREFFLDNRYDFVCRIQSERYPEVSASRIRYFENHLKESLLSSQGFTLNLLHDLLRKPWVGIAVAPLPHYSFSISGHGWNCYKKRVKDLCRTLSIEVDLDNHTPVAVYGSNFWFRPKSLRKLFQHNWKWEDFSEDPDHRDGSLSHALERLICYAAQDAGFTTQHVMPAHIAELNYVSLEYKLSQFQSRITNNSFGRQLRELDQLKKHIALMGKLRSFLRGPIRKLHDRGREIRQDNPMIAYVWRKIKG